jgi:hypothetical protein
MSRSDAGAQSWDVVIQDQEESLVDNPYDPFEAGSDHSDHSDGSKEPSPGPVLLSADQIAMEDITLRIDEYNRLSSKGRITLVR